MKLLASTRKVVACLAWFCCLAMSVEAEDRTGWTSSRVVGSPDPPKPFHVELAYPGLQFQNPVELKKVHGSNQMLMLQLDGRLFAFDDDPDSSKTELVLDLRGQFERMRALGFALHPKFPERPELFIVSTAIDVIENGARLSRFIVSDLDTLHVDRESEQVLLQWTSGGHGGSTIQFDAAGLLYFSIGDGAKPYPPDEYNVGQDIGDLHSTICRIDIDHRDDQLPYRIPPSNPFVGVSGAREEIWAFGFRNPWRFSIDSLSGRLLCGDVGWELWESVFDVKAGHNYGWSLMEGPQPIRRDVVRGPAPISKPLVAYSHEVGQSITGGFVYHGDDLPSLGGCYLYGDYVSGLVWALKTDGDEVVQNPVIAETGLPIITFSQNHDRDILVVSYGGQIHRLVKNPIAGQPSRFPNRLSETGLFESLPDLAPAPGVYKYALTAQAFHPGTEQTYHVAVPNQETIKVAKLRRGWRYPTGTVFSRTFSDASGMRLETQLLHFDGRSWQPYSYAWNQDQTDAMLVDAKGGRVDRSAWGLEQSEWSIQARNQCRSCHTGQAGGAVGFSFENLGQDQVKRLVDLQLLNQSPPSGWAIREMVNPDNQLASIEDRARTYLAVNCSHCHLRGGGGSVPLDLLYGNPTESINAVDLHPTQGDFGIADAKVIAPGDPSHSVLIYRMATSGVGRMPKLAHGDPDTEGITLIYEWIKSLGLQTDLPTRGIDSTSAAIERWYQIVKSGDPTEGANQARAARDSGDSIVEGLFERFLPNAERRQTIGANIDPADIMATRGDASRGRTWLLSSRGNSCVACHRVEGIGNHVGPRFDGLGGQRTKQEILASILDPSSVIDPKYQTVSILNDEGKVTSGLLISETESHVMLRSADGKDHSVGKNQIESQKRLPQSIMPSGLFETMTRQELADLVEYLFSLK